MIIDEVLCGFKKQLKLSVVDSSYICTFNSSNWKLQDVSEQKVCLSM